MYAVTTFANGQLPDASAAICTAATGESLYVKNLILSNVSAGAVAVTLWKTIGADHRQIYKKSLAIDETVSLTGYVLAATEAIRAEASAPTAIDYVIDGLKQT